KHHAVIGAFFIQPEGAGHAIGGGELELGDDIGGVGDSSGVDPEAGPAARAADEFMLHDLEAHGVAVALPGVLPEIAVDGGERLAEFAGDTFDLLAEGAEADGGSAGERGVKLVIRARAINFEEVDRPGNL